MSRPADAVAEGVAIAGAAARLSVRNRIIVDTIGGGGSFDPVVFAAHAREILLGLAAEQDAAAARTKAARRRAWGKLTNSAGTHDYGERDMKNLRRRRKQYLGVANALRAWADDPPRVAALVQAARDAAWADVEGNLQRRLDVEGMTADSDPDYARTRQARMDTLRMVDLAQLALQARRRHGAGPLGDASSAADD